MKPFDSIKNQELSIREHVKLLAQPAGGEYSETIKKLVRMRVHSLKEYRYELQKERDLVNKWIEQGEQINNT